MTTVNCPFCDVSESDILISNELCYARLDQYPVSHGHILIIPFRHVSNYFDVTQQEKNAVWSLVEEVKHVIRQEHSPDGYNVGINIGRAAGQTIPHLHVHIIPRYEGDVDDPRGGVRGVIPEKQKY
jgi:diadenosine tetraphosphate (Ap4A) HIT family hydrolase